MIFLIPRTAQQWSGCFGKEWAFHSFFHYLVRHYFVSTKKTAINKRDKVCPLKESVFWTANKSILSVMLSIINILRQRRVLIIKKQKQFKYNKHLFSQAIAQESHFYHAYVLKGYWLWVLIISLRLMKVFRAGLGRGSAVWAKEGRVSASYKSH